MPTLPPYAPGQVDGLALELWTEHENMLATYQNQWS